MTRRKFKKRRSVNSRETNRGRRRFLTGAAVVTALGIGGLGLHLVLTDPPPTKKNVNWLDNLDSERRLRADYEKDPFQLYGIDPSIIIPSTKDYHRPTREEINAAMSEIVRETHRNPEVPNIYRDKISQIEIVDSFKVNFGVPEKNSTRAKRLVSHAKTSIPHFINFIGSDRLQVPKVDFQVPQDIQGIKVENPKGIVMYLLDRYGKKTCTWYNVTHEDRKYPMFVPISQESYGESNFSLRNLTLKNGFKVEFLTHKAIFYRTSVEDPVGLLETPAIEVLHRLIRPYTIKNIDDNIRTIERNTKKLYQVVGGWVEKEESIVHAASILWWPQANKDLGLGLSEQQMQERFSQYDQPNKFPRYKGITKTAQTLRTIGVTKGVELYMDNPGELFE